MNRCFELALKGLGKVSPNPLVGCVIVRDETIIAEGFHRQYGTAHAEVDAINAVKNHTDLANCTLFVNLEPCNHFGKTPPCTALILEKKIPRVVICNVDSNAKVSGMGIESLRSAGVKVIQGVLEKQGRILNKRFFTFHEQKRPYVILKWAQTKDQFIDKLREKGETGSFQISGKAAQTVNHLWRSQEDGILIGKNTALTDNPRLNVRKVIGKNPIRILIDRNLEVLRAANLYNQDAQTLIFNQLENKAYFNHQLIQLPWNEQLLTNLLSYLHYEQIASIIVEGGSKTIQHFIEQDLWDEARVITSSKQIGNGLHAPMLNKAADETYYLGEDQINIYNNYSL